MEKMLQKYFWWLLGLGIALNIPALFLDIIEPDATLYASIAKVMAIKNDWVNLYAGGADWLDKPHFPFWMAALSFKLLGIYSFAYKLPSFIFWLLGLRFTFLIAQQLYDTTTARLAVLVYVIALHTVEANFDVRAEGYLTTCVFGAIWFSMQLDKQFKVQYLIQAALWSAFAVMTKGIFVLMTIFGGWVIYWAVTGQWKQMIQIKWWVMVVLIFVFISPELVALYLQFDIHPEKIVFHTTHVSGLKFFFWDSQFGRFFNTGPIKGEGDISFFLHTTLWAFLPWSVVLYIGFVKDCINRKNNHPIGWVVYGSALLTFLLFSFSKFQLPHYIIILFPHFSILTAVYLIKFTHPTLVKTFSIVQTVLIVIGVLLVGVLVYFMKLPHAWAILIVALTVLVLVFFLLKTHSLQNILLKAFCFAFLIYNFLFFYLYPNLFAYQSGMQAACWLNKSGNRLPVATWKLMPYTYSMFFYLQQPIALIETKDSLRHFIHDAPCLVFMDLKETDSLKMNGIDFTIVHSFDHYRITMLTPAFINLNTREKELEKRVLVRIEKSY